MPFAIALDAAIALLKRHRWLIIAAPLAIALAVQSWRLNSTRADLAKAQTTIAQMELASEQARAAQVALNNANQELAQRIADNARNAHNQNRTAVDLAVRGYAASHSLHKACGGVTGKTDQAALHGHPGAPDSPYGDEVVAIPRSDLESLSRDALRGAEARVFLIDLANEGLAIVN